MNNDMQKITNVFEEVVTMLPRRSDRVKYSEWLNKFKASLFSEPAVEDDENELTLTIEEENESD